jgi:hypothetical protein
LIRSIQKDRKQFELFPPIAAKSELAEREAQFDLVLLNRAIFGNKLGDELSLF